MNGWRRVTAAVLAGLLLAGCIDTDEDGEREPAALPDDLVLAALRPFDACDDYLAHVREHALELVTPWGLGGGGLRLAGPDVAEEAADDDGAAAGAAPVEGVDYSGTNVQEVGVDEPDHVKTDGRRLYVVSGDRLFVFDVADGAPEQLGTMDLQGAWDGQLLLDGDRLLITTSGHGGVRPIDTAADAISPGWWSTTAVVNLVDVSDPRRPEVVERLTVDGWILSARLVDGVARVVVRTEPGNLPFVTPEGGGLRAEREALEANREVIRRSRADDWIPYYVHESVDRRGTDEGSLVACNRIARPDAFSGLGTVSVLTVDLAAGGLRPGGEATAVLAGGDTVYASKDRLYVATTRWIDWEGLTERGRERAADTLTTEIHAFDISDPRTTEYVASGQVEGTLLSQWALSEHEGDLRVASTRGNTWWGSTAEPSESLVTVLAERGGELVEIGKVAGLGLTERIYAVRFMGDAAYVVTFREVDPLYTIDLSDPTDPIVEGELKILGYSAYLHPVGEDLILGVGQDAEEDGRLKGTQLSLFDVSDPTDPRRIDQVTLGEGWSDVEHDHRAFLHWPATGLTVVPFSRWDVRYDELRTKPSSGAFAFTATAADGITERGLLTHLDLMVPPREDLEGWEAEDALWQWSYEAQITRSLVVGDRLLTVSYAGVGAHDLDDLEPVGFAPFRR